MFKFLSSVCLKSSLVAVSLSLAAPVFAQLVPPKSIPSPTTPASKTTPSVNGYPPNFATESTEGCVKSAVSQGVKPDAAKSRCSCILTQLQAKIPFEKFKSLITESKKTNKSSPEIQDIVKSCQK